jgi:hypothetical protein
MLNSDADAVNSPFQIALPAITVPMCGRRSNQRTSHGKP